MNVYSHPINEFGAMVKRTKKQYPYSYDGHVLHRLLPNSETNLTIYSDRLQKIIPEWKWNVNFLKHFNTNGNYFDCFNPKLIQNFLREVLDQPDLNLVLVMEYCNVSNGFPVWRFDLKV